MEPKKRGHWVDRGWEGGRIWEAADGSRAYYIEKQVAGKRYRINTGATREPAALIQYRRFQEDPEGYDPRGVVRKPALYIDDKLTNAFLDWSEKEKKNTPRWVGQQRLYMAWWAERLRGVDLRRCSLADDVLPPLRRATCRPQRIAVLKVFFAWLRRERREVDRDEDPTLDALTVPQSKPAQLKRSKVVPREHLELAIEHLGSNRWRDLLRVLGGTGMHVAELERFAASGSVEKLPRDGAAEGASAVVVIPVTKAGDPLRVAVSEEVANAARRLLEAGAFDRAHLAKAIMAACEAAEIPHFGPGRLRHSVATWAVNAGADPSAVAAFLGHRSPRTTKKFYATLATPRKVPTLL